MSSIRINDEDRQEQLRMLVESAAGIAPRQGGFKRQRTLEKSDTGFDRGAWAELAGMGWLGLRLSEDAGGMGLGMLEYAVLAAEAGAALLPEPFIEAQLAIDVMGAETPAEALSGERLILPAWSFAADGTDIAGGVTVQGDRLSGEKRFVPLAAAADELLVTTAEGGWLVAAADTEITTERTQDGGHVGRVRLDGVAGRRIPFADPRAFDAATLANAACLLGVMERAFEITLDYLKTRRQFDRPIGSFQALQHRAVEMKVQIEITRAVIRDTALAFDGDGDVRAAVSRAMTRASEAAQFVTRQAIQMHGAIGYTDEADIGLFLRKTLVLMNRYGSASTHRKRHAETHAEAA
ncbi:acyl-CoA dehydrogenase family protein [Paracoccus sp. (in: a-proteobacteria)]|uniref:acyl-CoA dehydrogenase family protein n=1 Tax=Paracoccus sp. TaxID=267 RepID=UPI0026DF52D4|nr:acyl-CoA dehydrogenase family protein [Paracoccus sp. (in: a-proteobacteria)]MDO5371684.1 acyl-CoA dehydrogenase family protein [Paracoccus sp. (in: a-proteobacteria)]